jgi:hypothetical protein
LARINLSTIFIEHIAMIP